MDGWLSPVDVLSLFFQAEDANRTLDGGRKPLHYAADFGQKDVVEFLISIGADVNVRTATTSSHCCLFAFICLLPRAAVPTKNNSAYVYLPSLSKPVLCLLEFT